MLSLNFTALTHPLCKHCIQLYNGWYSTRYTGTSSNAHGSPGSVFSKYYFVHLGSTQQAGTITGAINLSPQGNHARSNISLISQAVSQHTLRGPQRTHPAGCFIDYLLQANVHAPREGPVQTFTAAVCACLSCSSCQNRRFAALLSRTCRRAGRPGAQHGAWRRRRQSAGRSAPPRCPWATPCWPPGAPRGCGPSVPLSCRHPDTFSACSFERHES